MEKGRWKARNYLIIGLLGLLIVLCPNIPHVFKLLNPPVDTNNYENWFQDNVYEALNNVWVKHKKITLKKQKYYNFSEEIEKSDFDTSNKISKNYSQMVRPTCQWNPNKEACIYKNELFQWKSAVDSKGNKWIFAGKNNTTQLFYNDKSIFEFSKDYSETLTFWKEWTVLEIDFNKYNPAPIYTVSFLDWVNLNEKYWYTSIKEVFFYKWNIWFIADNSKIYYKDKVLEYDFWNIQNKACCENPSLFQLTENGYIQFAEKLSDWYKLHEINLEKSLESIIDQERQTLVWEEIAPKTCISKEEVKVYTYMYHYIRDKNWDKADAGFIRNAVITENFDAQMKKFSELEKNEKIKIIFLSDLEKYQQENCYPHKNLVVLTSDDGWDDNYINLYPIAKKYNTKFHLSIISNYTQEKRYDNFMTKAEVQEVSRDDNFEIIGHTFAHVDLRNLNDFYLSRELCTSKESLEKLTNTKINTIIYPAGKYDANTIKKSQDCGYVYWFTTKPGVNSINNLENIPFELKRIRVSRDTKVQSLIQYFE